MAPNNASPELTNATTVATMAVEYAALASEKPNIKAPVPKPKTNNDRE